MTKKLLDVLSDSQFLYILQIIDAEQLSNNLRVIVSSTVNSDESPINTGNTKIDDMLKHSCSIEPDFDNMYEIMFDSYVIYSVTNESFDSDYQGNDYIGDNIQIYKSSAFLDYAKQYTITELAQIYENTHELLHVKIQSLNHILNVVTAKVPTITKV